MGRAHTATACHQRFPALSARSIGISPDSLLRCGSAVLRFAVLRFRGFCGRAVQGDGWRGGGVWRAFPSLPGRNRERIILDGAVQAVAARAPGGTFLLNSEKLPVVPARATHRLPPRAATAHFESPRDRRLRLLPVRRCRRRRRRDPSVALSTPAAHGGPEQPPRAAVEHLDARGGAEGALPAQDVGGDGRAGGRRQSRLEEPAGRHPQRDAPAPPADPGSRRQGGGVHLPDRPAGRASGRDHHQPARFLPHRHHRARHRRSPRVLRLAPRGLPAPSGHRGPQRPARRSRACGSTARSCARS